MNLSQYLSSPGSLSVAELRKSIGASSDAQIRQWQHGYAKRRPGPVYCRRIELATDGLVTRRDLRPDDWRDIWPELAEHEAAGARAETVAVVGKPVTADEVLEVSHG